eukprot:238802_1
MVQGYVDKFELTPLPKNLQTETYKQPRFIANFSGIKSFYEYCSINTHIEELIEENEDSDDSDDSDDELDDIVWNPWYVYRIRIWAKFSDEDWKNIMADSDDEEEEEEDDDDDTDDDSDDDDDAELKSKKK